MALAFPAIDPVAIEIGPIAIRWYALAYIAGILGGWRYAGALNGGAWRVFDKEKLDDFVVWVTFGIIAGGRLGYVLFYKPGHYLQVPHEALFLWHGGMSFHGGAAGVILAIVLFARKHGVSLLRLGDLVAQVVPIGLFFGRLANFANGELFGRAADVPWAMVFPNGGPEPRHPSQLYQAGLEGILLGLIMSFLFWKTDARYKPGYLAGQFLIWMGLFRFVSETVREPDVGVYGLFGMTMGQTLCVPLIVLGLYLVVTAKGRRERVESIAGQQSVA